MRDVEQRVIDEDLVPDCEKLGKEHEWERVEYDPSTGLNGRGNICVVCNRFESDARGDDDD